MSQCYPLSADLDHEAYHQSVRLPKYNGKVSVFGATTDLDASKVLRRLNPVWTIADHEQLAEKHAAEAARLSTRHSELLDAAALETFGRKWQVLDYKVSAIGRDEFSEEMKTALRLAAHGSTYHELAGRAHAQAARSAKRSAARCH